MMLDKDYPYVELNSKAIHGVCTDGCLRCPICNKVFYIPYTRDWVYKTPNNYYRNRYLCSWSCLNKARQRVTPNRKYKPRYSYSSYDDY